MLSLFDSFKVPGVDSVMLYRDDEDAHKFYMVPTRPSVARDANGDPFFTFLLFARNLDALAPEDHEIEQGYLSLTTRVGVSREEEDAILQYLRTRLEGEMRQGFRFLLNPVLRAEPTLSYPPVWTDGTVDFFTFGSDLVKVSAGVKEPLLVGENAATFSQYLSQDGAELFRQSVEKGIVPAIVLYKLHFLARIPAVSIHIHGNRRQFYEELRQRLVLQEIHGWNGLVFRRVWPAYGSLREFQSQFHSLTIDIDSGDFREGNAGEDVTHKLEELAFKILETNILPSFFDQGFAPADGDPSKDKWLSEPPNVEGEVDVQIKRRDVVKQPVNPNTQLARMLTPQEVKSHTSYLDLSQTLAQELDLRIHANVNFAADPIFAVQVFVDYDEKDEIRNLTVAHAQDFTFKTGTEVYRMRTVMAKAADGTPKDTYRYHANLVYKDGGGTIRIPAQGEFDSRERTLIVSYRRLGFVRVALALGAMPDTVVSARVTLRYPDSSLPSATQSFELTPKNPTATYFTHTGRFEDPKPYRYRVAFVLADGQRMELPEEEGTAETLTIANPFEQTVTTRFLAQADFTVVQKIIVDARYQDAAHDFGSDWHAELEQNGQVSTWGLSLRDPEARAFTYDEIIVFKNGARETRTGKTGRVGTTVPVGVGAVDALQVSVDVGLLDWSKFARALVFLEYADAPNNVLETTQFRFDPQNRDEVKTWKVLLRDKTRRTYRFRYRLLGRLPADDREVDWAESQDPFLVIR